MTRLARRINQLLESEVAVDGDGSLLARALGPATQRSEDDLAFARVETLLAAWRELHRERTEVR